MKQARRATQAKKDGYLEPLPRIAYLFELSEERVRQFVKLGIFARRDDGMLDLQDCIHNYERYLYDRRWRE
jgi:hypothetical protein